MLAAAGLPPHAVKASVGAKKLDYLYAAYTLVTEQPLTLALVLALALALALALTLTLTLTLTR